MDAICYKQVLYGAADCRYVWTTCIIFLNICLEICHHAPAVSFHFYKVAQHVGKHNYSSQKGAKKPSTKTKLSGRGTVFTGIGDVVHII